MAYYLIWYLVATLGNSKYLIGIYLVLCGYSFFHFKYLVKNKSNEARFVVLTTLLGLLFDSLNNNIFAFHWKSNYLSWLFPIWLIFSMTLNYSLAFIFKNKLILIGFSFFGGPWAYYAASKVMNFHYELNYLQLGLHGLFWSILMLIISFLRIKLCKKNSIPSY